MDDQHPREAPLEPRPLNLRGLNPAALLDALLSRTLRYDVSRTDVVKWVGFARNLLGVLMLSVVTTAALIAFLSTRQSADLLRESLTSEGQAVAGAVARAAFVPLSLEDQPALESLVESFRAVRDVAALRVVDASGRTVAGFERRQETAPLQLEAPVRASAGAGPAVGRVEVAMTLERVRARTLRIALVNAAVSGLLIALVSVLGFLVISRLTERMRDLVGEARLAEQLSIANRELEAFSYSVSHDLRAPLRHVMGFIDLLGKRLGPEVDAESRRYMDLVSDAAARMGRMIDDLLSFSKMGRAELQKTPVALSPVVWKAIEDVQPETQGRDVRWTVRDLPTVPCDPSMIQLVFQNLVGNAVKFTRKRQVAEIEVGTKPGAGREVVVYVRDNGVGFDMRHAEKLFGVFRRLHSRDEFEGTGIGLANVRRIVERHGGRVWAEGEPGKGATLYFSLPLR